MLRRLLVLACLLRAGPASAQTIYFLDAGTAETQDMSLYQSISGGASSSTVSRNNARAMQVTGTAANANVVMRASGGANDTRNRLSFYWQATTLAASNHIMSQASNAYTDICLNASNVISLAMSSDCGTLTSTSVTASTGTWYRLVVTCLTDGANETGAVTVYSSDGLTQLGTATNTVAYAGQCRSNGPLLGTVVSGATPTFTYYYSDIYFDNGTGDPGNINVTFKQPVSNSTNNFDTNIGANPANRWTNVNELPLSLTNGWQQAGASQVAESYGLQTAASTTNTSTDVSAATIVGWGGWADALGQSVATTPTFTTAAATTTGTAATGSGSCAGKASATTCVTGSFAVTAGDLCIAGFADQVASTAPTIGNSGTAQTWSVLTGPTTSTVRLSKWYSVIGTTNASMTVTFTTVSSAASRAGAVACFTAGAVQATPLDINATNTSNATSTYSAPATGARAQANEWTIGLFAFAGPSSDNVAAANGFTKLAGGNGAGIGTTGSTAAANTNLFLEYKVESATTTDTPQATNATSNRAGVQGTATFKYSGAGTPQLTVNGSDNAVTLATSAAGIVTAYTTSASYPSGTFGMKSSGTAADTSFYEGGVLVAYIPAVAAVTPTQRLPLLGVGPGAE